MGIADVSEGRSRILVVDDEENAREHHSIVLSRVGHTVEITIGGNSSLPTAEAEALADRLVENGYEGEPSVWGNKE